MLWNKRGQLTGGCWLWVRSAKEYTTFWEGLGLLGLYCLYVFGVSLVGHGCETQTTATQTSQSLVGLISLSSPSFSMGSRADDPVCAGIPPMMAKDRAAWRAKKEAEVDLREHLRDHRNSFAGLEGDTTPLCPAAFWSGCRPCCSG